MARRVQFQTQRDFTGGLNLAAGPRQLKPTETPDCLNVDMDSRGGFGIRRGVRPYLGETPSAPRRLIPYVHSNGRDLLIGAVNGTVYRWDGGDWVSVTTALDAPEVRSAVFKDRLYMVDGATTRRWDGTNVVALSDPSPTNYNNNISAPTVPPSNGRFPKAKVIASHQSVLVVGNITEGTTEYPNRIRWSHPLFPEDWMAHTYIDIEPDDGDEITALVPQGDRLIVFKHNSVHALYGVPPEDFSVAPIARSVGAPSQEAVAPSDQGIMFWHHSSGAHILKHDSRGTRTEWVFERLWPALEDNRIASANSWRAQVGYLDRRWWVSVPWGLGSALNRVFVYDPFAAKDGMWTFYDLRVGPFLQFTGPRTDSLPLAASRISNHVLQVDVFDQFHDDLGGDPIHIDSYYRTHWWDLGEPAVKKRWKRPVVVLKAGSNAVVQADVYRNYDPTFSFKKFNLGVTLDGEEAVWDEDNWDEADWAREGGERDEVVRGSPLGNAVSVSLKFTGPPNDVEWRLDALTMKYIPRRVRN